MTHILGIDIGNTGGIGLLTEFGALLEVHDLPTIAEGPHSRPRLNGILLGELIRRFPPIDIAYAEFVTSRPTDGAQGAFAFGMARGVVEGVLGALQIRLEWLTVPVWRKALGMRPGASKEDARAYVVRRWPDKAHAFALVNSHDRAEACCVGLAGIKRGLTGAEAARRSA